MADAETATWTQNWIKVGQKVVGSGISANTTITAVAVNGLSSTISRAAIATATATLTFENSTGLSQQYQSGWCRWSAYNSRKFPMGSNYYTRTNAKVKEFIGLKIYNPHHDGIWFNDVATDRENLDYAPKESWIYNVSAARGAKQGGHGAPLEYLIRYNGISRKQFACYQPEGFSFLAGNSEDVLIGNSVILNEFGGNNTNGFQGAIAHLIIYNRTLSPEENRKVLGHLYSKYNRPQGRSSGQGLDLTTTNNLGQLQGFAGEIFFE